MIELVDLHAQQARIRARLDEAIRRVLEHGQYIMGPEVAELETKLAAFAGASHCVSCSNGTDALLLPLLAWKVGPGDAVFVPAFTFMATAEVVSLLGARPVFVDADPRTFNLDPVALEKRLASLERGLKPRAVIAVDLFGQPADYGAIRAIARKHGLLVLQDSAQSFGAVYRGERVGRQGDVTATSFFPSKPLGAYGDGGACFTSDARLSEQLASLRAHGKGASKYDHARIGLNARLDTLQAAILLAKLEVFEDELKKREAVAAKYTAALEPLAPRLLTPRLAPGLTSAWAQYSLLADGRDRIVATLAERGIATAVHYPKPLHLQPAYASLGYQRGDFPVAESLCERIFSLPMHPYLAPADQERVIEAVREALT